MAGKRATKSDWTAELEARFQSVFKPYPNHSCAGEAREEFRKINPDDELLHKMATALEWQIPVFDMRAARAKTVTVVPHFRRWLHNAWWEEEELDGFVKGKLLYSPDHCPRCGHPIKHHGIECYDCRNSGELGPCAREFRP